MLRVCVYEIVLLELQIFTFNSFSLVRYPAPLCPLSTPLLDLQLHELCQQTSAFLLGSVSGKHKQETGGREKYELRVLTSLVMRSTRTGCSPDSWSLILLIIFFVVSGFPVSQTSRSLGSFETTVQTA